MSGLLDSLLGRATPTTNMDDDEKRALGLLAPDPRSAGLDRPRTVGSGQLSPRLKSDVVDDPADAPAADPNAPPPEAPFIPGAPDVSTPAPAKQGFMDRVQAAMMRVPPGMESLLGKQDVADARKQGLMSAGLSMLANAHGVGGGNAASLGQSLQQGYGAMQEGYSKALDTTMQGGQIAQQLQQQQRIAASRQRAVVQYAPQPGDTREQRDDKLRANYADALANGDFQRASAMKESVPELYKAAPETKYEHVDQGDKIGIFDPRSGRMVGSYAKGKIPLTDEQKLMMENSLGLRQSAADDRHRSMLEREDNNTARKEARLVGQYETMQKPFALAALNAQAIEENAFGALHNDPVAQQNLLIDNVKLMFPGQVVTAGQLHEYAGLLGLGDKGVLAIQKLQSGAPLTHEQVTTILGHARALIKKRKEAHDYIRTQFQTRAGQQGVDPEDFVDHFGFLNMAGGAADAPPANRISGDAKKAGH